MDLKEAKYRLRVGEHILQVHNNLEQFCEKLDDRGAQHDLSKLQEPEFTIFMNGQEGFENVTFGTPEYKAHIQTILPAIKHHHAHNSHHPEFHLEGVKSMSLADVVEMVCDWKAASDREGNDFNISLEICLEKYIESPELRGIIRNTALDFDWDERKEDVEKQEQSREDSALESLIEGREAADKAARGDERPEKGCANPPRS